MITLCDVRKLGEFIQSRIFRSGFKTVEDFARQVGVGKPTVYRLFERADASDAESTQPGTLERVATGLRFREWSELVQAWEADDVLWGLSPSGTAVGGVVELSPKAYQYAKKQAGKRKMDVAAWVEETIMPAPRRVTRPLKSGEGAAKPPQARPAPRP